MCGRLSIHKLDAFHALADALGIPDDRRRLDGLAAHYNVGPTMPVPTLVPEEEGLVLEALPWGFQPAWAARKGESRLLINARAETVFTLPTFRDAVRRRRAVVLANGFYEWQRDARDRPLQPWYVSPSPLSVRRRCRPGRPMRSRHGPAKCRAVQSPLRSRPAPVMFACSPPAPTR